MKLTSPQAAALLALGVLIALTSCERAAPSSRSPVRVAAAADLTFAFEELGRKYTQETGQQVVFSFGSTGLLAAQLRQGAPFDLFAAANVSFVEEVIKAQACDGATQAPYARGRIALWMRRGVVAPATQLQELAEPRFARVAIASPEHAPYGMAAREALEHAHVWHTLKDRLVFGENIRQTYQFAQTGNVEAAIVALSLVIHDRDNPWVLIGEGAHRPIEQALVVCRHGANRDGGAALARFINSASGREIMRRYGFMLPGEALEGPR